MSFNRLPATTNPAVPATIKFFWETTELFDSVQLRTSYRAKMIKNQEGESQLDDFALSPQEKRIFVEYLKDVIYELATAMFKLTKGISTSVFVDTMIELPGYPIYVDSNGVVLNYENPIAALTQPQGSNPGEVYEVGEAGWGDFSSGELVWLDISTWKLLETATVTGRFEASGFSIIDNNSFNENVLELISTKMENCIKYFVMREWYGSLALEKDMVAMGVLYKNHLTEMKYLTHELRKPLMT